jgi:hypothetical protein
MGFGGGLFIVLEQRLFDMLLGQRPDGALEDRLEVDQEARQDAEEDEQDACAGVLAWGGGFCIVE